MNKTLQQLNDDLDYAESTLRMIYESCDNWLNDHIREGEADFVAGIIKTLNNRYPTMSKDIPY